MNKKIILYSHDGKLGDAVVMTGLVEALYQAGFLIYVTASRGNYNFWRADRRVQETIDVPKTGVLGKLVALWKLRRISADYLFSWDLHRSSTGSFLARFSGASNKVGFYQAQPPVFDTVFPFDPSSDHITRKYEQALKFIGLTDRALLAPRLGFSVDAKNLDEHSGYEKKIFVNFFGSVADKSFTAEASQRVLHMFNEKYPDVAFIVCCMKHQTWVQDCATGFKNIKVLRTDKYWRDLYAVIQACDAVVTVDTSIAHISAALNKPLLDIFCKDSLARVNFLPVGENILVLESTSPIEISRVVPEYLDEAVRKLVTLI
jgi:ADP-heptose:LPS heptosyltransferase